MAFPMDNTLLWSSVAMLFVATGLCQVCEPPITIPSERMQTDEVEILCTITSVSECTVGLQYMILEKQLPDTDIWDPVAQISPSGTTIFPKLENGYTLDNRASGDEFFGIYTLTILSAVQYDSGPWRCKVRKNAGDDHIGKFGNLTVNSDNAQLDVTRLETSVFLMGDQYRYRCYAEDIYPLVDVIWEIGGTIYRNDTSNDIRQLYTWQIEHFIYLRAHDINNVEVNCTLQKNTGNSWMVENSYVPESINAPAVIENGGITGTSVLRSETNMNVSCTATGTNVQINWFYNGGDISELLNVTAVDTHGKFSFGQSVAKRSSLTWTSDCDKVDRVSGDYICKAEAIQNTESTSDEFEIQTDCGGLAVWIIILIVFIVLGCVGAGIGTGVCFKRKLLCFKSNTVK